MTEQDQFKACAELDGWTRIHGSCHPFGWEGYNPSTGVLEHVPDYSSRDVLIPLIQKQIGMANNGHLFILHLWEVCGLQKLRGALLLSRQDSVADHNLLIDKIWELFVVPTVAQLREALLRSVSRWKD